MSMREVIIGVDWRLTILRFINFISSWTSLAQIPSPRRISTSFLWRQGQQHPRPSLANAQSMQNCRPRGTIYSRQLRSRHSVPGDHARLRFVRTWGGGSHNTRATLERPHSSSNGWTLRSSGAMRLQWWARWLRATSFRTNCTEDLIAIALCRF